MFEYCSVKIFTFTAKNSTGNLSTLKTHELLSPNCREEIKSHFPPPKHDSRNFDIECVHMHYNATMWVFCSLDENVISKLPIPRKHWIFFLENLTFVTRTLIFLNVLVFIEKMVNLWTFHIKSFKKTGSFQIMLFFSDLQNVAFLMALQRGFPAIFDFGKAGTPNMQYLWWAWPQQIKFAMGTNNIKWEPLVDSWKVLMPLLHIKLGLMKSLTKDYLS